MLIKSMRMQVRVCNKYMHAIYLAILPCWVNKMFENPNDNTRCQRSCSLQLLESQPWEQKSINVPDFIRCPRALGFQPLRAGAPMRSNPSANIQGTLDEPFLRVKQGQNCNRCMFDCLTLEKGFI